MGAEQVAKQPRIREINMCIERISPLMSEEAGERYIQGLKRKTRSGNG
jgi:hypothetical protein